MSTPKQMEQQQQQQVVKMKNSGIISYNSSPMIDDKDEEMTRSALSAFRAKEEEIERKRKEVSDKVQAQLGRVEEETKRLAEIREVHTYLPYLLSSHFYVCQDQVDLVDSQPDSDIYASWESPDSDLYAIIDSRPDSDMYVSWKSTWFWHMC